MAKTKLPTYCFYVNILIFIGLVYLTYTMRPKLIEGVIETNCCGGIKPGVHYKETDRRPPEYVRRCFKSTNGDYGWSGFPCTQKESEQCCPGDRSAKCIPSSLGGYCKGDTGDYIYEYKKDKQPYLQFSSDKLLDIDNIIDMKDYFYNRSKDSSLQNLSPEMKQFMARKDENQQYMQQQMIVKNKIDSNARIQATEKIRDQQKNYQITYIITVIHLLLLVTIAIVIRPTIVAKIQNYLDILKIQYMKFSGK